MAKKKLPPRSNKVIKKRSEARQKKLDERERKSLKDGKSRGHRRGYP